MVNTANNPTNTIPKASTPSPPPPPYSLSFKHTASAGACAVCKHQRRKCPPDCPLAPHFPAYKQRDFLNVHKLFGVRNLTRALAAIDQRKTHDFMVSVIYEANARAADPVGGCLGLIQNLNHQLKYSTVELDMVNQQLAFYRSRQMANPPIQLGSSSNTPDFIRNDHRFPYSSSEKEPLYNGEVSFAGSVKLSDGIGLIDNSIKAKEEGEEDLKNAASKFSLRK
nr:LOB domain-containing protein 22-like [Ipomoea batatas]